MRHEQVLWALGEHTPGKHLVLQGYLNAWLPILGMSQERIVFIDGFAGPGEYEGGEPGSPLIALRAVKEHAAKAQLSAQIKFLFVESDEARVRHLRQLVDQEKEGLPPSASTTVIHGKFDETMAYLLDTVERDGSNLAPCFLMVDPFGVSGTPMTIIKRVLRHPKSEAYVSFMYEFIDRFKGTPEFEAHLDTLFGCRDWLPGLAITSSEDKKEFFFDLYRKQLKAAGARYVIRFELYRANRLIYAIFFATKHLLGCDRMKQAIWKVAPFGDFAFRGVRGGQLGLSLAVSNYAGFGNELITRFGTTEWLSVKTLEQYAQSDETDFHSRHLKKTLAELEASDRLTVDAGTRKRRKTYPAGTRLKFQ